MTETRTDETAQRPRTLPPRQASLLSASRVEQKGNVIVRWITSTDHKTIGYMYIGAALLFFLFGGLLALLIRAELFEPGIQVVPTKEQYNQLFTMHGTIMLLMFATPLFAGFANAVMPLQIGAPDVAFPRLNALSFWLFLFGSLIAVSGYLTPQGAAGFGWTAYQPLSNATFSPGAGGNLWFLGLGLSGFGTICMPGANSSARMTRAITPPRRKNSTEAMRYMYPIVLWSVEVIHLTTMLPFCSVREAESRAAWRGGRVVGRALGA